jgi:hypothetical protein
MAYNGGMTNSEKWHGLNKCLETLSKELDKEFKDYPDTPEVKKLISELRWYKRESFINWMLKEHYYEMPDEIKFEDIEDSDGGHVPDWAFHR